MSKECPKCHKTNVVILAGGCGCASKMAHYCRDCGHRWEE